MNPYVYTDKDGDKLEIAKPIGAWVNFKVQSSDPTGYMAVNAEDAPAVALAILEAAGIEGAFYINTPSSNDPGGLLACATFLLRQAENCRAKQSAREAEDAKVRAWYEACWPREVESIGVTVDDNLRRAYRASAEHHQQDGNLPTPGFLADARADFAAHAHAELAQPTTIDDAEDIGPTHRRREWVDQDGLTWSYDYKAGNWGYRTRHGKSRTVDIPDSFPWTEVTKP